jgi:hypothetical protein
MDPTKILTYISYEEIFGRRSTFDEFVAHLQRYSKESLVYVCCLIGTLLELWKRGSASYELYEFFVKSAFDPRLVEWLLENRRVTGSSSVFHRRQLLLVQKVALLHCSDEGVDALRDNPGFFGVALLMANDHFHYANPSANEQELENNVLTEFVAVNEFSGSRVLTTVARASIMRNEIAPTLTADRSYVDINRLFGDLTGLSLDLFGQLCMATFTKYNTMTLTQVKQSGDSLYLNSRWFYTLPVTSEQMRRFVDEIGATDQEYRALFTKKAHFGHNDFTSLKDRPIYLDNRGGLAVDLLFVVDKFSSGPFWRIHNSLETPEARQNFRSFWGRVFERYVHRIMQRTCDPVQNLYVPNPTWIADGTEVCDAFIVRGNVLICLEYKANMFTAESKYSGVPRLLLREIKSKLIENEKGKKKGVGQLASVIGKLFGSYGSSSGVNEFDMSKVSVVIPVLVTLDDIGGSFLITKHLGDALNRALPPIRPEVQIKPLFSMSIETLEVLSGYLKAVPLDVILEEWHISDPALASSLLANEHPVLKQHGNIRNVVLDQEFSRIWKGLMESVQSNTSDTEKTLTS